MAELPKQPIEINFAGGLDQKTDDKHVSPGKFLSLVNSVFDKVGQLTKRNGFPLLSALPSGSNASYLTTFGGDLQAVGTNLQAYSPPQGSWVQKGSTYPIELSTMPLIRNSLNQSQADVAVAPNGLVCTVYTESADGSTFTYKYSIADSATGQNIVEPVAIPVTSGIVTFSPRVFLLGYYFIILFGNVIGGATHLQYVAISTVTGAVAANNTDVAAAFTNASTLTFDGYVYGGNLYIAYNGAAASGIKVTYLTSTLASGPTAVADAAHAATHMSVYVDPASNPIIWVTYYSSATNNGYTLALSTTLAVQLVATQWTAAVALSNITSLAASAVNTIYAEVVAAYAYDGAIATHWVGSRTVTQAGVVGTPVTVARSIGLASKAFKVGVTTYFLGSYSSSYQPGYFLINATSTSAAPVPVAKLAYQNGGGYLVKGLPNVTVTDDVAQTSYLFKDLIQAVNKNTNVPTGSQVNGIYSQTGVNMATFTVTTDGIASAEIGSDLHLSGGFLWSYDGYVPVEHNFLLYPENVEVTTATGSGGLVAQTYFYQATYEWTDNQGNAFRSAPSIPVSIVTTTASSTNTIHVPTLRLTYKVNTPVKIVLYRWSTAQQSYYQVTSITAPVLNDTTTDAVTITDTASDATILGNNLLYTTGGVIENTSAPASNLLTLFDTRLWLVDAEDQNLLWYSKTVVEGAPVEMSDLLTLFVAPSVGSQGPTGPITATYPMDDKLIVFKKNSINYINGTGPNALGQQSQYSEPIFVTATVGCTNPRSLVMTPLGVMFQSSKGIWLLERNLSTKYIGAPVEGFNGFSVSSAVAIPDSNQVRFGLSDGTTLMYDYFVDQWGTFEGIPSVSATLFQDAHTIVNQYGQVSQELSNTYLDGARPVLMSFTTSWMRLAGIRGYQRAYWMFFLGTYLSPHKLQVEVGYDYNSSPVQSDLITTNTYEGTYGDDPFYGGDGATPYGGTSNLEQARVFLQRQRCKAVQFTIQEVFDASFGTVAGPGLTLSGLTVVAGVKKSYAPINSNKSVG